MSTSDGDSSERPRSAPETLTFAPPQGVPQLPLVDPEDLYLRPIDPSVAYTIPHRPLPGGTPGGIDDTNEDLNDTVAAEVEASMEGAVGQRYALGEELGRGGSGRVLLALDRQIGRPVALKVLYEASASQPELVERFLKEARITGQLEHPSVVPIYDMGKMPDGQPFYTMRVVPQRSLRDILTRPALRQEWSLARLCGMFAQLCRAMAYAHARGVVHRDLKPENVLLGQYGEVYVADWGIAKLLGHAEIAPTGSAIGERLAAGGTQTGMILGTPGYLPPEQALGEWEALDHRADIFSLGAMLYEILTGRTPFEAESPFEIVMQTISVDPRPPHVYAPDCPLALEDVCMQMLSKDKVDRPGSAEAVAAEVDAFLEGAKEKTRRLEEAQRLVDEAGEPVKRWQALREERRHLGMEARKLLQEIQPWEPAERKRPAWALEEQAREADVEAARQMARAAELYARALGRAADHPGARAGMAELYWSMAEEALAEGREPARLYYESLVREYDDGNFLARLTEDTRVSLRTTPPGAALLAYRFVEIDRALVPAYERHAGRTPIVKERFAPGSWLFILRAPDHREVRYTLLCRRGEHHENLVNLYGEAELGASFVYVPAGSCVLGGDPEAIDSLPRQRYSVGDFGLGRFPVTFDEYLMFLSDLAARSPAEAARRLPRDPVGDVPYAERGKRGGWVVRPEALLEATAGPSSVHPSQAGALPVVGVDWSDAVAYCNWLSARDRLSYRLPTELEWEKAARGGDGRAFPWGSAFEATSCKMRDSRPGTAMPEPVGAFAQDESPYGVRDLGGGVRDWVADLHGGRLDGTARVARGGAWSSPAMFCRAASRQILPASTRSNAIGFRIAKSLRPHGREAAA